MRPSQWMLTCLSLQNRVTVHGRPASLHVRFAVDLEESPSFAMRFWEVMVASSF